LQTHSPGGGRGSSTGPGSGRPATSSKERDDRGRPLLRRKRVGAGRRAPRRPGLRGPATVRPGRRSGSQAPREERRAGPPSFPRKAPVRRSTRRPPGGTRGSAAPVPAGASMMGAPVWEGQRFLESLHDAGASDAWSDPPRAPTHPRSRKSGGGQEPGRRAQQLRFRPLHPDQPGRVGFLVVRCFAGKSPPLGGTFQGLAGA
jgi:hypothetical protein